MGWRVGLLALAIAGAACSSGQTAVSPSPGRAAPTQAPRTAPTPAPTPPLPPYVIESLRARPYPGGKLQIGDVMATGAGYTKHSMTWPSNGQTMTGTISLPAGAGPFPVGVV